MAAWGVIKVLVIAGGLGWLARETKSWALGLIAFCFALSIGALWEIFEFTMDQVFGLNMQKSGLVDTMWDLIVDMGGALIGASAGFFWLKGRNSTLTAMIDEVVHLNRKTYRKVRKRMPRGK